MKPSDKPQMIIANRLRDGFTVFLGIGGAWVQAIDDGAVARDAAQPQRCCRRPRPPQSATSS